MQSFMYSDFVEFEKTHWWFIARRQIVMNLLKELPAPMPTRRILDLGCGVGGTLGALANLGWVVGLDSSQAALRYSRLCSGGPLIQGTLEDGLPFKPKTFHVITMLDLLEHIENDIHALTLAAETLVPGGYLVCTVPAFSFLWSGHDAVNLHKRRYQRADLADKIIRAGLTIRKISYYNFWLFAPIWLRRSLNRWMYGDRQQSDFNRVPVLTNLVLAKLFESEYAWLRSHTFPFGVSLLAIASKT